MTVVNQEQKEKTFRIELEGELLAEWGRMLKDRKITQTNACMALIRWIVRQDPLLQALIFEQQPPRAEVLQIIFGGTTTTAPMTAISGDTLTTTAKASDAPGSSQRNEQVHRPPHSEESAAEHEGRSGGQKKRPRR
jgi:hypothetical protein